MGEKMLKGMDDELRKMFVREENLDMSRLQVSCSSISTPCLQRCGCSYGHLPTLDACIERKCCDDLVSRSQALRSAIDLLLLQWHNMFLTIIRSASSFEGDIS